MRKSAIGAALLICVACKLPTQSTSTSSTSIIVSASGPTTDSNPLHVSGGWGAFTEDRLQICNDVERTYKTPDGPGEFKKKMATLADGTSNPANFTMFPDGCVEVFKDASLSRAAKHRARKRNIRGQRQRLFTRSRCFRETSRCVIVWRNLANGLLFRIPTSPTNLPTMKRECESQKQS